MINTLAISGYRSLRDSVVPLGRLTIVTGPNGSGKSSFYRSLRLMNDIAHGGVIRSLASEGGLPSTLWAGPESFSRAVKSGELPVEETRRKNPVALKLGFAGDDARDIDALLGQGYRGSRYSFGYPACPNLADQRQILELLGAERVGVALSEEDQLHPEQSTSAIVVHHPQAKYFSV